MDNKNINECRVSNVRVIDFYNSFKKLEQEVKASALKERQDTKRLTELWNKLK